MPTATPITASPFYEGRIDGEALAAGPSKFWDTVDCELESGLFDKLPLVGFVTNAVVVLVLEAPFETEEL